MRKHLDRLNIKLILIMIAVLAFFTTMFIALLPKSPTEPPKVPEILRLIAGNIGDKYWWALVVVGLIAIWLDRRMLWRLVLTLLVTQIAIETFKLTVGEMRPSGRFFNSFPSGHTAASFAFATVINENFRWGWLLFLFATAVGLSRIISHSHWWHDVVGGAALGYIVAIGTYKFLPLAWRKVTKSSSVPEQPKHLGLFERSGNPKNQSVGRGE